MIIKIQSKNYCAGCAVFLKNNIKKKASENVFYLISKLEMEEINKGMEKLMYCIEHDVHDQDIFSEDQMPVVWETSRKRKECLKSLKLDLISFVPVYNCPLTIYIGRDNAYYKYFKYGSFRFHAMQKVNLFYSDQISNEERN